MPDEPQTPAEMELKTEKAKEIVLPTAALALDLAADGKTAYVACHDGAVHAVDLDTGKVERVGKHESYASGVAVLPGGGTLVSAGYDGVLLWHDIARREAIRRVQAHDFWSWNMAVSLDGSMIASATGRYEAGGYRYEPAPEREPSVKIFDARTGELRHALAHVPPVQAVAFSPDGRHAAAGNLMGEVRVWDTGTGQEAARWTTEDFTSWGIIKSHHYLGGIFAMAFNAAGDELCVCGMGPMRDPMAGNGIQRWQRFAWPGGAKRDQTHEGESGRGLMEALAYHPSGKFFAMGGRLFQGKWNLAFFDSASGKNLHALDAKHRITGARFTADGSRLVLAKAKGQEKPRKDGGWPDYGQLEIHTIKT